MLGYAARFSGHHIRAADGIEQRRLPVIDMAHDGDDRRARLERLRRIFLAAEADLDIGFADALDVVPELGDQQLCGILVDRLVDGDHHAHFEQRLHQIGAALRHAVGKLLNGDRFRHDNVAHLLGRRPGLLMSALFLLSGTLQGGERAGAIVVFA
jgi:hypothetical protein